MLVKEYILVMGYIIVRGDLVLQIILFVLTVLVLYVKVKKKMIVLVYL